MRVRCALLRRLVRGALPAASTSLLPPSSPHSYNVHAVAATCALVHGARYCTSTTAIVDKDESDDNDNDHTTTDAPLPLPPPLPSQQQQQQSRFTPPPPPPPPSSSSSSQPAAPADVDVRQFARLLRRVRNAQPRYTPADTTRTPNAAAAAAAAATDEATAAAQRAQALRCVTAVSLRHVIGLSADTLVQCLCTLAELRAPPTLTMIDDAVSWLSVHATTLRADQLAQSLYALHRLRCPQLATLVISLCDVLLYSADLTGAWDSATLLAVVWHVLGSTATNAMSITTTTTATTTTRTSAATLASSASTAVVAVLDSPVLLQLEARLRARVSHTLQYVSRMNAATLLTALAEASAAVAAATSTSTSAATAATAASLCDVAAAWATVARALRQVLCGEDANNNDDDKSSSSSNSNSDSASSGGAAAAAADGDVSGGVATLPLSKVLTLATSLARIDAADSSSLAVACSALHEELVCVRAVVLADVQRRLTSGGDGGVVSEEELLQLSTLCLRGALRDEALCTAVLHTRTRTHLQRLAGARRRHGDGGSCSAASLQFVCDVLQLYMREQPHRHTTRADNSSGDDDDEVVAAAALTTRHAMPSFLLSHIHDALDAAAAAAAATTTDTTLRRAMVWPSSCVRVVLEYMCSQPAERDTALRLAHCHYTNALAPAASQPSSSTTAVTLSRLTLLPDDLTALFVDGVIDVYAAQLTPLLTAQLDRWDVAQVLAFLEHASLYYARCIAHEDEQRQLRAQQDDDDKDDGEDKDSDTTDEQQQQQREQSTSSMPRSCTRHNDDDGGNSGGAAAATTATTTRQPQRGMRAVAAMLRAAAAVLAKYVERASPAQLAALMRCYGRTGVREESFCRAVVQRFVELVSELSLSQVCDVLLGLAAVEYAGDTRAFVEAAHVLCEAVARGSGSAQVVTQLLAAYATMLVWDHRLLRCLADRLVTLHETSAALVTLPQLMTAGVAMLRMDMRHDTLTRVLHARVAQLVDELSHVATTTTTMMHDSNSRAAAAAPVSSPATLLLSSSQALQLVSLLSRLPLRCDVGVFVVLAQYAAYGDDGLRPSPDVSTTPRHNNNNTDPSSSSSSSSAHGTQSPPRQQQQQQRRLRELSSDEVAELLLSLVRAGVVQHTGALFDALALRAVGLVPTASPEALVCIVDAHARAGRRDEELFASVAECVLAHNMHMAAVTIAALLSCFARAGMVHDKLFVEMIPRVRHVVHYGSVQDVVHVVYAYATVRVWHYQLFAKLAERAVQLSGDMTCAHAATLLDSFATVGMRHERLFADLAPRLVTIAAAARAREAVAIVESYARMQQRNVAVLDAYVSHLAQGIAASTVTIADAAATTGDGDVDGSNRSSSRGGGGGGCAPTLYFASDMDECASNSSGGSGLDSTAQTLTHEDVTALLEALGDLGYYHAGLAQALRPFVPLLCDAYEQQCDNAGYVDVNSDTADDGDDNDDADKVNDSDKDNNNNVSNNGCGDEAEDAAARPLHSNA